MRVSLRGLLAFLLVGFAAATQAQNTPPSFRAPGWTEYTAAGTNDWTAVTASADGRKLVATVDDGKVWTSVNEGVRAGARSAEDFASSATEGAQLIRKGEKFRKFKNFHLDFVRNACNVSARLGPRLAVERPWVAILIFRSRE